MIGGGQQASGVNSHSRSDESFMALHIVTQALRTLMDARDEETAEHSGRVTTNALSILSRLDKTAASDPSVRFAFNLHDVGKAALPDSVLLKPGSLDADEWDTMRKHPVIGADVLESVAQLRGTIAPRIVRHHHERWNGTGYPNGLVGTQIPVACRAFAVADAFDAMTNDRPYRRAMPIHAAMDELRRCAGSQFDPQAVEAFEDVVGLVLIDQRS